MPELWLCGTKYDMKDILFFNKNKTLALEFVVFVVVHVDWLRLCL
jgi:hypothetical protein